MPPARPATSTACSKRSSVSSSPWARVSPIPSARIASRVEKAAVQPGDVERLENWIDGFEAELPPLRKFILPGGSACGAWLHFSRTVCRRAERRVVGLGEGAVEPIVVVYLNRLSDLLFVMARTASHRQGLPEAEW